LKWSPDSIIADDISCSAVLFCRLSNLQASDIRETVKLQKALITQLDRSLSIFGVEKIKSIGKGTGELYCTELG
jgi:hypothetical protein